MNDSPTVRAINRTPDLVAHMNRDHAYTIPPPPYAPRPWMLRQLETEHAAIHAERVAQEHMR